MDMGHTDIIERYESRICYAAQTFVCLLCLFASVMPSFPVEHYVFTPVDATQGLSSSKVRNIVQLPDGRMMVMTEGQLNLYDGTRFSYLHYDDRHFCPLSEYSGFHHIYIDAKGYMWIKNQYWLMAVDIGRERFVEHPETLLGQWGVHIPLKDMFVDKKQNLWLVTEQDDLLLIGSDAAEAVTFLHGVSRGNDQLYDLGVLDGKLYLFYRSGLLVCYDLASGHELYQQNYPDGLSPDLYGMTSFVVQGEHTYYQLCNGRKGGVMLNYDVAQKQWKVVMSTTSHFNYLSMDRDDSVWVSGPEGLYHMDANWKQKQHIPTLQLLDGQKIDVEVSTLYNDSQGGMWVGTLNRGILYYHPDRFRFRHIGRILFPLTESQSIHITGFAEANDGSLMVNTDHGCFLYDEVTGDLTPTRQAFPSVRTMKVPGLEAVPLQVIEMGKDTLAGITRHAWFIHDKRSGKTDVHSTCHSCNAIAASRGQLWIGLEDGLLQWNASTGEEQMFYTADGLINNSVRSLICASDGSVWISTASGISRLIVHTEETGQRYSFVNYNRFDGVITDEFCERSVCMTSDGTLYWGGINGFNCLSPLSDAAEQVRYTPLFVGFSLFGEQVQSGQPYHGNVILERPITMTREIVLEHDQNFFTIEFSALNYVNPTQTYYRYRMEGMDRTEREIRSADGRGNATYTDLPPGNYIFRVRAADNGRSWTDRYAELHIRVKAPFWQTGYAYLLYALLAAGCVGLSLFLYVRRKKRNLVREQKEKLDEMKATFLQNINRELEEPVERILTPIDNLLKHTDEGRVRIQLQEIRSQAAELKDLVGQFSEGVLLPLSSDENTLELDSLLVSMRNLLSQQEKRRKEQSDKIRVNNAEEGWLSDADEAFIRKALEYVEQNLDNPEYSVEVLSRDMGMDRTGLYRKLVAVVGKTPTNFIRSIRLKRAAQLLEEGYTVAEVADSVGFSTSSYLSKCFQEEYGMRPSQYVSQRKKR